MEFRYDKKTEKLIIEKATKIEYHQMDLSLTRHPKDYRHKPAFKAGFWDGFDTVFNHGKINQGLWKECFKACQTIGSKFNIINKEDFPINREVSLESVEKFCAEFFKNHKHLKDGEWVSFYPYDHQIESAFKILKNKFCIVEVATSGGKSLIISIVFFYIISKMNKDAKMLLIVPSISLVTQFYNDLIKNYYGANNPNAMLDYIYEIELKDGAIINKNPNDYITNEKGENIDVDKLKENKEFKKIRKIKIDKDIRIAEIMSDSPRTFSDNPNIYIGTYQSLINYPKEFFHQFYTVVCDEAHTSKAVSLKKILSQTFTYATYRFGVSGTFPPEDSMESLYIQSVLGPMCATVEAKTLIEKGIITQMDIKVLMLNHNDKEFNDKLAYIKKAGGGMQAYLIEKEYIHLSEKRLNFIKRILEKCNDNTLILFETIEYGKKMLERFKKELPNKEFYYIDGNISGKNREIIFENMEKKDGIVKILISTYGTLSTGVSINNIFNIIFTDSFKSEQRIIQSIGRALRLFEGKTIANIFDLVDIFEKDPINIFYKQSIERQGFYNERQYPFKIIKINL